MDQILHLKISKFSKLIRVWLSRTTMQPKEARAKRMNQLLLLSKLPSLQKFCLQKKKSKSLLSSLASWLEVFQTISTPTDKFRGKQNTDLYGKKCSPKHKSKRSKSKVKQTERHRNLLTRLQLKKQLSWQHRLKANPLLQNLQLNKTLDQRRVWTNKDQAPQPRREIKLMPS